MANDLLGQRRAQMFPKLTSAQLARLESRGTRMQTSAGEILVELGAPPRGVFVVAAGSIEALAPPSATQAASGGATHISFFPRSLVGSGCAATIQGQAISTR